MFKIVDGCKSLTLDGMTPWGLDPKWYDTEMETGS